VRARQVFHYGEAQTGPAHVSGTRSINSIETFEEPFKMLRGDSFAGVFHQNAALIFIFFEPHHNAAALAIEFDGVFDQVGQHLFEPSWIDMDYRAQLHVIG
jgi:hypothetical protein